MRPPSATLESADDRAVSEIMGVSMLLAMVISTMAGVVIVMQPFMEDLTAVSYTHLTLPTKA